MALLNEDVRTVRGQASQNRSPEGSTALDGVAGKNAGNLEAVPLS